MTPKNMGINQCALPCPAKKAFITYYNDGGALLTDAFTILIKIASTSQKVMATMYHIL